MAEMAHKAMDKRKGAMAEGSIAQRVKSFPVWRAPALKTGGSSGVVVSEKSKTSSVAVDATPLSFAPPEGASMGSESIVPPGSSA